MGDRTQSFAFQQAQMLYDIARSEQQIAAITQEVLAFKEGMNGANALFVNLMSRQAIAADEKDALLVDLMAPFSAAFQQFMEPFMKHKRHADIAVPATVSASMIEIPGISPPVPVTKRCPKSWYRPQMTSMGTPSPAQARS